MTTRVGITGFYLPSAGNYVAAQVAAKNADGTFDIVTWPGYLCYSGDMGCFVFTRLPDMF